MKSKTNLKWILIFAAIIAVCATFILYGKLSKKAVSAEVYSDNKLVRKISDLTPDSPYTFKVKCDSGYNEITVANGSIWVSKSDCKNQTCVHEGKIGSNGGIIICAPHKLIIKIVSSEVDARVG